MSLEIIIPIAAIVILVLLFSWLVKVLQSTVKTVIVIAAILILLQVGLGINSEQIIQEIVNIFERLKETVGI